MHLVIPLGKHSSSNWNALKYCLRAIGKYAPDYEVITIGEQHPFKTKHVYRDEVNSGFYIQRNIFRKILAACMLEDVSNPFLLVYDDHILLNRYEQKYYQSGTLTLAGRHPTSNYYHTIKNTLRIRENINDFDCHAPILIHKEKFASLAALDWNIQYGYCIKSLYCSINSIEGEYHKDFKLRSGAIDINEPLVSLSENVRPETIKYLDNLFSEKSKFEK